MPDIREARHNDREILIRLDDLRINQAITGQKVTTLTDSFDALKEKLFGNGQPGIIKDLEETIENKHNELEEDLNIKHQENSDRIATIERKFWQITGGISVILFILHAIEIYMAGKK